MLEPRQCEGVQILSVTGSHLAALSPLRAQGTELCQLTRKCFFPSRQGLAGSPEPQEQPGACCPHPEGPGVGKWLQPSPEQPLGAGAGGRSVSEGPFRSNHQSLYSSTQAPSSSCCDLSLPSPVRTFHHCSLLHGSTRPWALPWDRLSLVLPGTVGVAIAESWREGPWHQADKGALG